MVFCRKDKKKNKKKLAAQSMPTIFEQPGVGSLIFCTAFFLFREKRSGYFTPQNERKGNFKAPADWFLQ